MLQADKDGGFCVLRKVALQDMYKNAIAGDPAYKKEIITHDVLEACIGAYKEISWEIAKTLGNGSDEYARIASRALLSGIRDNPPSHV